MKEYEPSDRDTFIVIKNGDYQRLVFGKPREFKDREVKEWEKFMEYIEK